MSETPSRPHPRFSVRRDGPVLEVALDWRAGRNSQVPTMWLALADVARTIADDVRVVVIRGEGPSFSAGLDRGMLRPGGMEGEPDILALGAMDATAASVEIARYQEAFTLWRHCPAIVIAAVQGHAVGAGFQLALGADLRIVAEDVQFVMAETSLGLVPDLGGTLPLVTQLGYARALEVCLTRRAIGAQEAVATGLANLAVPAADLAEATRDLVAAILAAPEPSVRATKSLLAGALSRTPEAQLLAERQTQVTLLAGIVAAFRAAR